MDFGRKVVGESLEDSKDIPTEFYFISSPKTFRSNSEYHVSVSLLECKEATTIKLGIQGSDYENFQTIELQPLNSKLLTFKIPRIKNGEYSFFVEGIKGLKFSEKKSLEFINRTFYPIFQTDKSTYKPGDLVKFRIFFLDPFLKPVLIDEEINFAIEDGKNNRVKFVKDIKPTDSVYSGEFQLTESPIFGDWTIIIESGEESYKKGFKVEEYVLPKFEVIVDAPKIVFYKQGKISATIRAKYTFGKPVKGDGIVKVGSCVKAITLDGSSNVEFDLAKDLQLSDKWDNTITITAIVNDPLTSEANEGKYDVSIKRDEYAFEALEVPVSYVPNESFNIKIRVSRVDGKPLDKKKTAMTLFFENGYNAKKKENSKTGTLNEDGILEMSVTPPNSDKDSYMVILMAEYDDCVSTVTHIAKKVEKMDVDKEKTIDADPFVRVNVSDSELTVGKQFTVKITTSSHLSRFVYYIVVKGDIIEGNLVEVSTMKEHILTITPTYDFIPSAKIFVYAVHKGEILSDESALNVEHDLPSNIELNVPERVRPGEEVSIEVISGENAFVGLLGIDKSATLLNNENELTINKIVNGMRDYWRKSSRSGGFGRFGEPNDFNLITNAKYPIRPMPHCLKMMRCAPPGMGFGGPIALESCFARSDGGGPLMKAPIIRKEFPEVWIWDDIIGNKNNGNVRLHKKIPDTITTWLLSGVTLDPVTGLNLTKSPRKIEVFQPFFVSTSFPYSVKRGEIFEVPITVFNYLEKQLNVAITLDNSKREFDFLINQNDASEDSSQTKELQIDPNCGTSTSFLIRPNKVGRITLLLTAHSSEASDAIEQNLLVEPEGVTQYVNKAFLVDLRDKSQQQNKILIDLPKDIVPDSTHIYLTAIGDLLGPTISNLKDLVRVPCGCGEQNMVNFVPNILVLKYFQKICRSDAAIEADAKKFIEIGYQRELTYRHSDGSYSAFGPQCGSTKGSTWLTAYVIRSFRQASKFSHIDEANIKSGLEFLSKVQTKKGTFPEVGKPYSLPIPKDEKDISITAFTLLAFIENSEEYAEYNPIVEKGLNYLADNIKGCTDPYIVAITAFTLRYGKHEKNKEVCEILQTLANSDGDQKWWHKVIKNRYEGDSLNVEITSFALLTLLEKDDADATEFLPILKWLLAQRNDKGGFFSSYDTVMGLQALIKAAERIYSKDNEIAIKCKYNGNQEKSFTVDKDNSIVLQSAEISANSKEVEINSTGRGTSMVQVSYKYNVKAGVAEPRFVIKPKVKFGSSSDVLQLAFAVHFIPNGTKQSKMAMLEVNLPSGYVFNSKALKTLAAIERVQKVEIKKADTLVIIYFEYLDKKEIAVSFEALKVHNVEGQKPVSAVLYDYYDTSSQARVFYSLPGKA